MHRTLIALVLAALLLAGCALAPQPPQGNGEVSFMVFGDPAEKAAYDSLVAAFSERHPEITVNVTHIPSQSDYRTRVAADLAAGTPADVVLINYRNYAPFADRGTLEPLGPYLAQSSLLKEADFFPQAIEAFRWNGTVTCIPQNVSSLVVYYNQKLFDEAGVPYPQAGWSWNDFLSTAQALTRDTDNDGTVDQYGLGTEVEMIRLAPFIWQLGGDVVDNRSNPTRLTLSSPQSRAALEWFADLQRKHHVAPDATQDEAEDSETRFMNGRLGMLLNSRRTVPTLRTIEAFEWDVAPLPQADRPATILHSDAYCMAAVSQHKQDAWTFIEFANRAEGQTIIARTGRTVPSLQAVAQSPAFLDPSLAPKSSQVFLDVIPYIQNTPTMAIWPDLEEAATAEIRRAFYGTATVEEATIAADTNTRIFFAK